MAQTISTAAGIPASQSHAEQHSLAQSLVLHLLPGLLATAVYVLSAPLIMGLGFPALLAAYLVP